MIVQDLIKLANIDEQVRLICSGQDEYEEPYDPEVVRGEQQEFIDMLLHLKPKKRAGIIIFEKWFHDPDDLVAESVNPEYYRCRSVKAFLNKIENMPKPEVKYDETTSAEDLEKMLKQYPEFPQAHSFIFDEWEKILGWNVYEGNIYSLGLQKCIQSLLYEMSFNGVTREHQDERRDELTAMVEERNRIKALPEKEQEEYYQKNFCSHEELMEELGIEESEAEKEEAHRKGLLEWLKNLEWKYNNFLEMKRNML